MKISFREQSNPIFNWDFKLLIQIIYYFIDYNFMNFVNVQLLFSLKISTKYM